MCGILFVFLYWLLCTGTRGQNQKLHKRSHLAAGSYNCATRRKVASNRCRKYNHVVLCATVSATCLATFSAVSRYVKLCFVRQVARKIAQCGSALGKSRVDTSAVVPNSRTATSLVWCSNIFRNACIAYLNVDSMDAFFSNYCEYTVNLPFGECV